MMSNNLLALTAESDRALIDSSLPTERLIEVTLQAPRQESSAPRAAVNVALVIDRSGSMAGGKLDYARKAAGHVLDTLTDRDRAAVVFYDDEISLLAPSAPVTNSHREHAKREIKRLRDGNSTNLGGGWLRGAQEVAENLVEEGVNRALLLTDGLANVGITDPEELAKHARELRQRRVSTSTFGIGLDFNERLLERMAEEGGGKFYFIRDSERIPAIFAEELGELLSVTARELMLRVHVPESLKVEALGGIPHRKTPESITFQLGDLCSGQTQSVYLKVLTPPGKAGDRVEIMFEATYAGADNSAAAARAKTVFTYASTPEVESAARNQRVEETAGEVQLATELQEALVMERAGDREGAAHRLRSAIAYSACAPMASLQEATVLADSMEDGLTEDVRKSTYSIAYLRRQQRK